MLYRPFGLPIKLPRVHWIADLKDHMALLLGWVRRDWGNGGDIEGQVKEW